MRPLIVAALTLSTLTLAVAPAMAQDTAHERAAVSAERYGVEASYVVGGHGYSLQARHMTDCLATYRTYDVRTDRVQVRPGVSRRCTL